MQEENEACDQCGSREFYVEAGRTYCANGHDQNRGAEIGEDEDDYGTLGKRINTRDRTKKQKILKVYRGKRAYHLFLQAYQHILWKQCHSLIHEKGFPDELWTIVRDLWSLRLSKLLHRLEDPFEGEDSDTRGLSSGVGSQDESGGEDDVRSKMFASRSPSLIETICLCYMAMLILRVPISLNHVLRWIQKEDLPYIRAIRYVPAEMRDKLPGEYHEALDTSTILRPEVLQAGVSNVCAIYIRSFGVEISPLNSTLILYDYIKSLSLPLEVYAATKHLNKIVKFDFKHMESGGIRRTSLSYPEAQLMSIVVVATKLLFPFDQNSFQRHPRNGSEETVLSIDWNTWAESRKAANDSDESRESLENSKEIYVKDTDVFDMSADQLDQYMDWYQRTWTKLEIADDNMNKELLEMFLVRSTAIKNGDQAKALYKEEDILNRVKQIQARLRVSKIITDEQAAEASKTVLRPGMRYQTFRDQSALSLFPVAHEFHQEAAEVSCLSLDMLLRAVLQTERKITLWRRAKRRTERFGEDMDVQTEASLPPGLEGLDHMTLAEAGGGTQTTTAGLDEDTPSPDDSDSNMRMIEE